MNQAVSMAVNYFLLIVTAVTVENVVLARGLGISRLISLADDTTDTVVFGILLTLVTTLSGVGYYFLYHHFLRGSEYEVYLRAPAVVLCMAAAFLAVFVLAVKLMPYELVGAATEAMPVAAFNGMVFGTTILACQPGLTIAETVTFSVGSGVGFTLAVLLVTEGQRKLQNRDIPAAFKGLPATLLYLAGLAVAVYGLTGYTFSL